MKTTHQQVLALLLALALLLSLCACGQNTQTEPDEPKISTDTANLPAKADKNAPENQPEEAISQSGMSDRTSRDEAIDTLRNFRLSLHPSVPGRQWQNVPPALAAAVIQKRL